MEEYGQYCLKKETRYAIAVQVACSSVLMYLSTMNAF